MPPGRARSLLQSLIFESEEFFPHSRHKRTPKKRPRSPHPPAWSPEKRDRKRILDPQNFFYSPSPQIAIPILLPLLPMRTLQGSCSNTPQSLRGPGSGKSKTVTKSPNERTVSLTFRFPSRDSSSSCMNKTLFPPSILNNSSANSYSIFLFLDLR